ncbi:MAG TPA: dihydrodipicolinate synthase family protein [Sedimentisphaerales bacterium]|nr:dihydrodipicolinate synthase family protein [Sedimentisphaerales bacterium]
MNTFRGLFPPMITPFNEKLHLDEKRMREHVDFLIAGGVDGLCAGSSTGEFSNLTREEWEEVLEICLDQVGGRVPMLAGTAAMSTAETVERSQFAEELGFDGLLVISPWYQVHTQREIYEHFKILREAVSVPIMIYNNPPVTGIELGIDLLERLTKDGIIQYIKDANSDPYMLSRLKMRLGDQLRLFYGHDNNAIGAFAFGATGWVSGSSNFDPQRWSTLVHLCIDDHDYAAARKLWYEILPFIEVVTVGHNGERPDWIAVIKRGLELRGRPVGGVRPPMLPVTPETDERLCKIVAALSFEEMPTKAGSKRPMTTRL